MHLQIVRAWASGEPPGAPVYRQIADQIREHVRSGELSDGDRLPPIRELARRLGVNRDTVCSAYESLAAEGVVDAQVGRGTFVRSRWPRGALGQLAREVTLSKGTERLLDLDRARVAYGAGRDAIPLHALVPDPRLFPVEAFRRALARAFRDHGAGLLEYGAPEGYAGLREALAERLRAAGTMVGPEALVLCQGASQGISLAMRLYAEWGDAVALESPTYHNALATLASQGLRAVSVPMHSDGVDLDALDRTLARPEVKLFYTIPSFHNPMGVTTSLAHREALLGIAARHGKAVVEDAFQRDLRYVGRPLPSLAGLDQEGIVVQLLSFSKSLFPGLRAGAVLARGRSVDALLALRGATDLGGALPLQVALADFLRSGAYDRHLSSLRRHLRARRDAALEALAAHLPPGSRWTRPDGGCQVWVELPEPLDSRELHADALRAGVLVAPGFQFHHDGHPSRGLRLSLARADESEIREGVTRLGRVVRERLAHAGLPATAAVHV